MRYAAVGHVVGTVPCSMRAMPMAFFLVSKTVFHVFSSLMSPHFCTNNFAPSTRMPHGVNAFELCLSLNSNEV